MSGSENFYDGNAGRCNFEMILAKQVGYLSLIHRSYYTLDVTGADFWG